MVWAIGILIVVALGCGVLAARGQLGELGPVIPDRPGPDLPKGSMTAADLSSLTFAPVLRGYAPDQVKGLLATLASMIEGGLRPSPEVITRILATKLDVVTRGLDMGQVDAVVDRVIAQLLASPANAE